VSEGTIQPDDDLAAVLGRRVGDVWVAPDGRVVPPNYGKHDNEGDALQDLVERLVSQLDPQMIWLFGSRARGDARQDSDFDLLVVAKHGGSFGTDDYERVRYPTIGAGIDAEVVPCSLSDFAEALELKTSFVSHVTRTGRLVHGGMPS
jgi:hypothetical protein